MPHDVFISYSTEDKDVANAVCHRMEAAGVRCWIAPRDVQTGAAWDDAIVDAMLHAKVVVLVFSAAANKSRSVRNEIVSAIEANKIVFPFRIENVPATGGLQFHLSRLHWLDAMTPPLEAHIDYLVSTAKRVLSGGAVEPGPAPPPRPPAPTKTTQRPLAFIGGVFAAVVLAAVVGVSVYELAQRPAPAPVIPPTPVPALTPTPAPTPTPVPAPPTLVPARPPPSVPAPTLSTPAPDPASGFIFPNSNRQSLTTGDLAGLSCAQLDIARNEIYARLGRAFKRPDLQSYFGRFTWYRPSVSNPDLNSIEQENVSLISQTEASQSCPHR